MPALVAALALVLQAFLTSWTMAAAPAAPRLDIFGNPLCITGPDGDAPDGRSGLPGCCTPGCAPAAPSPAPPPAAAMPPHPWPGIVLRLRPDDAVRPRGPDDRPGNPRAPPTNA